MFVKDEKVELFASWLICSLTVQMLINHITSSLGFDVSWDTALCMLTTLVLALAALPTILHRLSIKNFLFFAGVILIVLCSELFYPDYGLTFGSPKFFTSIVPYYFVGATIRKPEAVLKYLKKLSAFIIVFSAIYYIYIISTQTDSLNRDMNYAYAFLPCMCSCFYSDSTFGDSKFKINKIPILHILSISTMLLLGTRGPFVCLLAFIVLYYLFDKNYTRTALKFIPLITILIILIASGTLDKWLFSLNTFFKSIGVENRILDKLLQGEFLEDSGRGMLQDIILRAIKEKPAFGYGLLGDRYITRGVSSVNGSYAHNIIIEILCHFGIVLGGFLITLLTLYIIKALRSVKTRAGRVLIVFMISISIGKLMFSSTYINEPLLFMFIGICYAAINGRATE